MTARHEAAHAGACILTGRAVECVRVGYHADVGFYGQVMAPVGYFGIERRDMVIALVGYLWEGVEDWPPEWPIARDEKEALGVLVQALKLDESGYRQLVNEAWVMLPDSEFQRLANRIERALLRVPVITGRGLRQLTEE